MINISYRLISPKNIQEIFKEVSNFNDKVIVRPTHLSICKADQRYFQGKRPIETLNEKLPMALIHEAIGKVIKDPTGTFNVNDYVVMIPNIPLGSDNIIGENYLKSSKFRSSGFDGFMSDYVFTRADRLVKLPENINLEVASFIELISVSLHAISRFNEISHNRKEIIGVWGDGNLGFITSLLLKISYPDSEIYIFGKNSEKLEFFSFVDKKFNINEVMDNITVDHGFECVGGNNSQYAINQIIDTINPEGTISILGVCEDLVPINTRLILEKGLRIFGSSRSSRKDFIGTIDLINENKEIVNYFENLITNTIKIKSLDDIYTAFKLDSNSSFGKTVLIWDK